MKIRMKVEASGSDGMIQPGEEVEVGEATGSELIAAGLAELVEEDAPGDEPELAADAPDDGDPVEATAPDDETSGWGGIETE